MQRGADVGPHALIPAYAAGKPHELLDRAREIRALRREAAVIEQRPATRLEFGCECRQQPAPPVAVRYQGNRGTVPVLQCTDRGGHRFVLGGKRELEQAGRRQRFVRQIVQRQHGDGDQDVVRELVDVIAQQRSDDELGAILDGRRIGRARPAFGVDVVDANGLAVVQAAGAGEVGAEETVLDRVPGARGAAAQRQQQGDASRVREQLIVADVEVVDHAHCRVPRVAFTPANDTVAPADTLLPGCRGERAEREPAAHRRVGSHFSRGAKHVRVADQQALPDPLTIALDASRVVQPALALQQ